MRVREISALIGGSVEGNAEREITGAAAVESAGPDQIAFIAKHKPGALRESNAGCLIVTPDFPGGGTLIRVKEPRTAFARVVGLLHPPEPIRPGVHPSAVIANTAVIGHGCEIGPHVTIGDNTRIGSGSRIGAGCSIGSRVHIGSGSTVYANVTIYDDVWVGERAVLHSGCVLGADGFGFVLAIDHYEKFPQIGGVRIGDDVEIGANACVDRAALGVTEIGDGSKLDNMVHVGHNCRIGRHVVIAAQTGLSGGVMVGDYAVIGGQVGIGDKARIDSRAVVGSGSGILTSKIVRGGEVVWGTPARPLKQYLLQLAHLAQLPALRKEIQELRERLK